MTNLGRGPWSSRGGRNFFILLVALSLNPLFPSYCSDATKLHEFLADTSGELRAPAIMQRYGLEWLYRTYRDPRRLLCRYFTTNLITLWVFFIEFLATRFRRSPRRPHPVKRGLR